MRYAIRNGKYGAYFVDTSMTPDYALTLEQVIDKLNRLEEYTLRLAKANEGRAIDDTV